MTFTKDREYFLLLFRFALPIALQNLISSLLNMAAVIMIGQLGETSVAAVGLANQVWFLLNLMVFGIVSGSAIFIAQLWGKQDIPNIRRVVGLGGKLALIPALLFWVLAIFFPRQTLSIYTEDPNVIAMGSQYLRIFGWSYLFFAITGVFSAALRSTGNVRLPLAVSTSALGLDILLLYPFVFGFKPLGIQAMGVEGAALAGLIARVLECIVILILVYRKKGNPVAASAKDFLDFDFRFIKAVMQPVLPVILNETLWSLGITTYNAIYGHIGTEAVAAININGTIDNVAFVVFLGIGNATAIMVGNLIGQGKMDKAFNYAGKSLVIQGLGAMVMGVLVFLLAGNILQVYKVSPQVIANARSLLIVLSLGMWIRASNHVIIIGILRAGGDTRFSLLLDGLVIWLVGVPITAAGAFLFDLPIYLVYALTLSEEITKYGVGLWRYFSKKWINDLTTRVEIIPNGQM